MNDDAPPPTFEHRITQFMKLRDEIKEVEARFKAELAPLKAAEEYLKGVLLTMLDTTGQSSARTVAGTAYKKRKNSATIADGAAFRRAVIGSEDWDLVDWRANVTAVGRYIEDNSQPPPGVNWSTHIEVGVIRPRSS